MRLMPCVDATIWILWGARSHDFAKFPVLFPVCREFGSGDAFDLDCVHHHAVLRIWKFPDGRRKCGQWADSLFALPSP